MKIPALLFVAFLLTSCFYRSVALTSKSLNSSSIEGVLVNMKQGKEYCFKLNRPLPFKYGEMVTMEQSIRMVYVSSTPTDILGERVAGTSRSRTRIEPLDSIPKAAVVSIEREKVEVVRTVGFVVLLPILIVGVVFMFVATGGHGI